ncbi:MAG: tetratricopeptide repeat protein, partial [candidate division KSB1 bacterium]|nr:tetratricopeptide repeat protein [candidate division KSB1 bacterium]
MNLRFDELSLLHDIRDMVEADPHRFENIQNPAEFRREIRAKILPHYITPEFIRLTQEKLLNELLRTSRAGADQDALMTALVFLQSHTDLDLPLEDNPLWEIVFNLSIKDGLKFIDVLTVLMEGLDDLKISNPDLLTRPPIILQKTRQICQWPIFWKLLINHQEISPYEGIISAILRGDVVIEIYFDEVVHLPYFLYQLFKPNLNSVDFLSEAISDTDKERQAGELFQAILKSIEKDLPYILPSLIKRIRQIIKTTKTAEIKEELERSIHALRSPQEQLSSNIFLIALIAAKVSMKQYWENQRDQFFFMTILKDPLESKNYFDYGQILLKQKHYDNAYQLFQSAAEIDPHGFWGYWGLAIWYDRMKD